MPRRLLYRGEDNIRRQITSAANQYGAHVYSKVRVADAINIEPLGSYELGNYALKAHFDFVVADSEHMAQFAIEFDGPGHNSVHDAKKDQICRLDNLALFRINLPVSNTVTRQFTFVNYLVHVWFLGLKFEEMRSSGELPPDEAFMMSGFLKPDAKHIFDSDFDLVGVARGKVNAFCKRENIGLGSLAQLSIGELLLGSDQGDYVAFSAFPIKDTKLYGRAALGLKVPNFGLLGEVFFSRQELGQFCVALAIEDLLEQMKLHHFGSGHVLRWRDDVHQEIDLLFGRGFSLLLAMSAGDDELISLASQKLKSLN
jgi:hypothetical protein